VLKDVAFGNLSASRGAGRLLMAFLLMAFSDQNLAEIENPLK
jgi:hypothetical protein